MRENGLETPLQERRLIDAWEKVAGKAVANCTGDKFIRNQVLYVKIMRPALRSDLSMMRTQLVEKLNAEVGSHVIADIRFF